MQGFVFPVSRICSSRLKDLFFPFQGLVLPVSRICSFSLKDQFFPTQGLVLLVSRIFLPVSRICSSRFKDLFFLSSKTTLKLSVVQVVAYFTNIMNFQNWKKTTTERKTPKAIKKKKGINDRKHNKYTRGIRKRKICKPFFTLYWLYSHLLLWQLFFLENFHTFCMQI